jgi:protein-disulfide isomerase
MKFVGLGRVAPEWNQDQPFAPPPPIARRKTGVLPDALLWGRDGVAGLTDRGGSRPSGPVACQSEGRGATPLPTSPTRGEEIRQAPKSASILSQHALAALLIGGAMLFPQAASAQEAQDPQAGASRAATEAIVKDYLASHPEEVGQIVKGYFIKHPEAVGQILAELLKHRPGASPAASARAAPDRSEAIGANAVELFSSPHQVTLGDPAGDVTLVEFFDYSCGFCKRALSDTLALIGDDPHLKVVLKEFPILGPGSAAAARVAVAARMQDPGGRKYLAFHQELLGSPGPASEEKALAAARDQGFDMDRIKTDMASGEVAATLSEDMKLATALGFSGTPSYVIGKDVVMGAVGEAALKDRIAKARAVKTEQPKGGE